MTDQMAQPVSVDPGAGSPLPPVPGPPPAPEGVPVDGGPPPPDTLGELGPAGTMMLTPEEQQEIELRDHLGLKLGQTAMALAAQAAELSTGDPGGCKDMAQATLYLVEALVLVAPLESTGETAGPGGPPGPGGGPVPLPPKHLPPQPSLNFAEQQSTGRPA